MKKRIKQITKYFFLFLFIAFIGCNLFFFHTHIIWEQRLEISHSHPFKSDENGKPLHSHSRSVFLLVHLLNNFFAEICTGLSISGAIYILIWKFLSGTKPDYLHEVFKNPTFLRGPPPAIVF